MKSIVKKSLIIAQALVLCLAMMFTVVPQEVSAESTLPEIHISSYKDWNDAWRSLIGTKVKVVLDSDIELNYGQAFNFSGISGEFDLNGHNITSTDTKHPAIINVYELNDYTPVLTITGNGKVGIISEYIEGMAVSVTDGSSLTIKNGDYFGDSAVYAANKSTVVIEGGSFSGKDVVSVFDESSVTINNGSFKSKYVKHSSEATVSDTWHTCVYDDTDTGGTVTINGGTFDSTGTEMQSIRVSHTTINGGIFKGNCTFCNVKDYVDDTYLFMNGGDITGCTDFFFFPDDTALDKDHLKVSSAAKLNTSQRNQVSIAIAKGNAASGIEDDPDDPGNPDNPPAVDPTEPDKPVVNPPVMPIAVNYSPAKAVIKSVKAGKKSLTVKWKKVNNATGYNIQVAKNSKFTKGLKNVTVKKYSSKGKKIKSLKKGKKYYVRVRAYRVVNGKTYYGAWSKAKSKKAK
ncbi:MAG: hypothetical protein IKG17_08615 [Mogibacterium sp.]|nr:hypothetical protein [Mogibacterium sp.]